MPRERQGPLNLLARTLYIACQNSSRNCPASLAQLSGISVLFGYHDSYSMEDWAQSLRRGRRGPKGSHTVPMSLESVIPY
jgi:hypothetical protein